MLKQKDINLLKAYERNQKPEFSKPWMKYCILPCVLGIGILITFGVLVWHNHTLDQDIDGVNQEIAQLEKEQAIGGKEEKFATLQQLQTTYQQMKTLYEHMNSYPEIESIVIDRVFEACGTYVTIASMNYDQQSGELILYMTTPYVAQSDKVIRRLKDTNLFHNVNYSGYTSETVIEQSETDKTASAASINDVGDLDEEALKDALIKQLLQQQNTQKQNDVGKKTLVYRLEIHCVLKRMVKEG